MLGAIIGDIAGSSYEVEEILKKRTYQDRLQILDRSVPLFNEKSSYTDDSVLTSAVASCVLNNGDYEEYLRLFGNRELELGIDKYGRSRFGKGFTNWLKDNKQGTSYGNGSAMRISSVGYLFDNLEDVKRNAYLATITSHNHIEAIIGAEAVAVTIYLLRKGYSKLEIKKHIEENYYNLDFNLDDLQKNYKFSSKCINSVPQAIYCFLVSNDFEDAIRKSISIGGDSDTIACITGAISEAFYGINNKLIEEVKPYIPDYILEIVNEFYKKSKVKTFK